MKEERNNTEYEQWRNISSTEAWRQILVAIDAEINSCLRRLKAADGYEEVLKQQGIIQGLEKAVSLMNDPGNRQEMDKLFNQII